MVDDGTDLHNQNEWLSEERMEVSSDDATFGYRHSRWFGRKKIF